MKTYNIRYTSRLFAVLLLTAFSIVIVVFMVIFIKKSTVAQNNWMFLLGTVTIVILSVRLTMKIATVTVAFKMDMDNLRINSGTQTKFHEKLNYNIELREIESYFFQKERQFDKFFLTMKNKEVIKFFHNTDFDDSDDFILFLNDFTNLISKVNSLETQNESSFKPIQKKPSIYERPIGKLYAVGAVIIIVVVPTLMIWNKNGDFSGYGPMTIALGWAFFYLSEFYRTKRKTPRNN